LIEVNTSILIKITLSHYQDMKSNNVTLKRRKKVELCENQLFIFKKWGKGVRGWFWIKRWYEISSLRWMKRN